MEIFAKEALSIDVGQRLKALREERGISMRSLARRSGLSANALSMIERGLTSPSVSTLNKLANALEVPVTAFFRIEPEKSKVVYYKASQRSRISFTQGLWEGMGGENFVGKVEASMLTLDAGASSGSHGMIHSGNEFILCLQGTLEYEVEGKVYVLEPGDSLMFAARLLHHWRNPGPAAVHAVMVVSCFDEGERPGEYHLASANAHPQEDEVA